jgi:cell wall-associated NlpC family hydrolase
MSNLKLVYDYALALVGTPYRWGGSNPISGFDCSGLVQELLASIGFDPPGDQSAQSLYEHFIKGSRSSQIGLGALVFYGKSVEQITHVAFMLDTISAIGANGGGSKTTNNMEAERAGAFVKIRPLNYRSDLVAVIMPNYS